jgi:hypothetical protein
LGKENLRLRELELAGVVDAYMRLPKKERLAPLPDPVTATPAERPMPEPPKDGMIVRGYCTYLKRDRDGRFDRANQFYYLENPDRWRAETQSDLLWLTKSERESLVPADPQVGVRRDVAEAIQRRFYSTIGIDYMEGSVNSLPVRESTMTLTVDAVDEQSIVLRLEGYAHLGKPFDEELRDKADSRGSELRVLGKVHYDRTKRAIERFDVVGVGRGWGNKMDYVNREIRISDYPWMYGIAWELVTGEAPQDRIPPYNLLHYNATGPYFATDDR